MNIKEYVKNNKTYNFLNKSVVEKTQNLIENNENILYALVTNVSISKDSNTSFSNKNQVFGGAMQLKNVLNGVIAITDKRLIFCNSSLGTINEKQMLIKDIKSIDEHISGLTKTGELRVNGMTETFIIKILRKDLNKEIMDAINKARNKQESNNSTNIAISSADEIRKYKELLDDGIITQAEFEDKKRKLLQ